MCALGASQIDIGFQQLLIQGKILLPWPWASPLVENRSYDARGYSCWRTSTIVLSIRCYRGESVSEGHEAEGECTAQKRRRPAALRIMFFGEVCGDVYVAILQKSTDLCFYAAVESDERKNMHGASCGGVQQEVRAQQSSMNSSIFSCGTSTRIPERCDWRWLETISPHSCIAVGDLLMRQSYMRVPQGRRLVGRTVLGQFNVRGEGSRKTFTSKLSSQSERLLSFGRRHPKSNSSCIQQ